ncbi:neutral sphingomyelinase [Arctopsyche grandis]|uniref:neutral sphingomyelinase n=1 Tax=Arctopsyche grandis TaxID=121162 RepID=UPI00406D6D6B
MADEKILVNVFTLNCWGIPFISKNRKERMEAISTYLSKGVHDIVCLQEVWDESDYFLMRDTAKNVLPYSHYFYSGVCGSGLCILSRWPIEEVFFHAWPLNGYIHMIHHGDWFGGKGVGYCRVKYKDLNIHVYSAHLHAEYSTEDIYLAHRVLQAFNTAEFIKMTSSCADLVILAGDLNTQPTDLAFRLMCETGRLKDSCLEYKPGSNLDDEKKARGSVVLGTNERACNSYTDPVESKRNPDGKRIDYVLYHTGPNSIAHVDRYDLPLLGNVPSCQFSYSDHEAVSTQLLVTKAKNQNFIRKSDEGYISALNEAISVCHDAMTTLRYSARKYLIYAMSLFLLLLSTVGMAERTYVDLPRLLLVAVMFYFLIMGTVWNRIEWNGVLSGEKAMEIIYNNLIKKNKI